MTGARPIPCNRQRRRKEVASSSRPRSLVQCLTRDGALNIDSFLCLFRERARCRKRTRHRFFNNHVHRTTSVSSSARFSGVDDDDSGGGDSDITPERKWRSKPKKFMRKDAAGNITRIYPHTSTWYFMYVDNALIKDDLDLRRQFRNRFRMTYECYLELIEMCREDKHFRRWCARKSNNKQSSPVELLILGSLRYLGRGWTFDDIEESTAISKEVHRLFLHSFIKYGSSALFEKYVSFPINFEEAKTHMAEFAIAGLPGCVGSADCTHITTEKCEYNLKNHHLGAKSSHTTRSFSLTANHRRRILHTSHGGPGRWNDQTMVMYDHFIKGIHNGSMHLTDVSFTLKEYDRDGSVVDTEYEGGYIIVDNGFLSWSITVPPYKQTVDIPSIRWSKWVESMRKDVECTFGILKGRWRIVKTGVRVHGIGAVDRIWMTCCALHNWLLDVDGNSNEWSGGTSINQWMGELGDIDLEHDELESPTVFSRLADNLNMRNYDTSGMGPGLDVVQSQLDTEMEDNDMPDTVALADDEVRVVRDLPLAYFRKKLVEHFDIMYESGELVWPRSRATRRRTRRQGRRSF